MTPLRIGLRSHIVPRHRNHSRLRGRYRLALELLEVRAVLSTLTGFTPVDDADVPTEVADRPSASRDETPQVDSTDDSVMVTLTTVPTDGLTIQGRVVLDYSGGGQFGSNGPGLPERVVFVDANGSESYDEGEPTTVTDDNGNFTFTNISAQYTGVGELAGQAPSNRYRVVQTASFYGPAPNYELRVVPYSPIAPVPVVADPQVIAGSEAGTTAAYVQGLYRAVLGRTGSESELSGWLGFINSEALTDSQVAERFVNSTEHRTAQVASYYRNFLDRDVDPLAQSWVDQLLTGTSEQAVVGGILSSAEYQSASAHADAGDYVRDLYLDVLGRRAGNSELAAWTTTLAGGTSRTETIAAFVGSAEAADQLVTGFYINDLRRRPEGGDSSGIWQAKLATGASATDVAVGILASTEFRNQAGSKPAPPVS